MIKKAAKTKKAATTNKALEPVDILGNWTVKGLTFEKPVARFGLTGGRRSKFKIDKTESGHVLIKQKNVGWNGSEKKISLTEVTSRDEELFNANLRLTANVTFDGGEYQVSFGSNDSGNSLLIQAVGDPEKQPGGTGTGVRGGG